MHNGNPGVVNRGPHTYWEVRSAIDVMHLLKNLCVNILGFLGLYGKSKDTPEAREDQEHHKG
jgi:hypothetical protein